MDDSLVVFKEVMNIILRKKGPVKVYAILAAEYQIQTDISSTADNKFFNTPAAVIYPATDLEDWYTKKVSSLILKDVDEFQENGSGWSLKSILFLKLHVRKYNPIHSGSSYLDLPEEVFLKHTCINVDNFYDEECFKWAILCDIIKERAKTNPKIKTKDLQRLSKLKKLQKDLNINFVERFSYPMDVSNISSFEEDNVHLEISINVFILKKQRDKKKEKDVYIAEPFYCTESKKNCHCNLLLIEENYEYEDQEVTKVITIATNTILTKMKK